MAAEKIAIVTGGNKGIGYAIVKGLCEKFDGKVYLTSRDVDRGKKAVEDLKKLGFHPVFHQLDIMDQVSIDKLKQHIIKEDGGIDVLVNNAAIAFDPESVEPMIQQAETTIEANYFGLLRICDSLSPLLRTNAQVVNLSSLLGHLSLIPSPIIKEKFSNPTLTITGLNNLMRQFVKDVKDGKHEELGWGNYTVAYCVSKIGISRYTILQQLAFDGEEPKRNIAVNSVHPGYVNTDMTKHQGPLTTDEGANAPIFLAMGNHNFKGKYIWFNSTAVDWFAHKTPRIGD